MRVGVWWLLLMACCWRVEAQAAGWTCVARTEISYLDIVITGKPGAWRITDRAPFALRPGYEFWYYLNHVRITSATPLTDYPYAGSGVLDIKKKHYKVGLDTEARWSREFGAWGDLDASYVFGPRADIGGQAIFFCADDAPAGGIAWLDQTPSWYRGSRVMSWPVDAPPLQLPAGKMLGFAARVADATPELRQRKGETHTPDHPDARKRLGPVVGCRILGITEAEGPRTLFEEAADRWPLLGAAAFEMNEGTPWIPHQSAQSCWFLSRLTARYAQAGWEPYILCADYGGYGFCTRPIWEDDQRWRYTVSPEELRRRDAYLGGYAGVVNTINVKHYGTPPEEPRQIFNRIAHFESIKKAGYRAILFGWNFIEVPGTLGYGPGYAWEVLLPEGGRYLRSSLSVTPFDEAVAHAFLACWYGDGVWVWDGQGIRGRDATQFRHSYDPAKETFLAGARVLPDARGFEPEPDTALDGYYIGAALYAQCRATEGGTRRYLPFTLDGKIYPVEPDGSDVLTACREARGICQVRIRDTHATLLYYNPCATLTPQEFSVTLDGTTYRGTVAGRRLFVAALR